MKKMKRNSILTVFILLFSPFFAEANFNFSSEPNIGVQFGKLDESVYASEGYRCSLLEWEISPLWTVGYGISGNHNKLYFDSSINISLPVKCGSMHDFDWNKNGINYNYSKHENYSRINTNLKISLYYLFKITEKLNFGPSIDITDIYNSFESKNGYGWYGNSNHSLTGETVPWNDENAKEVKVYGIQYSRNSFFIFIGFNSLFTANEKTSIQFSCYASPFTFVYASDHHMDASSGFHFQGFQYAPMASYKMCLKFRYFLNKKIAISSALDVHYMKTIKGTLLSDYYEGKIVPTDQKYGSSGFYTSLNIGLQIAMF